MRTSLKLFVHQFPPPLEPVSFKSNKSLELYLNIDMISLPKLEKIHSCTTKNLVIDISVVSLSPKHLIIVRFMPFFPFSMNLFTDFQQKIQPHGYTCGWSKQYGGWIFSYGLLFTFIQHLMNFFDSDRFGLAEYRSNINKNLDSFVAFEFPKKKSAHSWKLRHPFVSQENSAILFKRYFSMSKVESNSIQPNENHFRWICKVYLPFDAFSRIYSSNSTTNGDTLLKSSKILVQPPNQKIPDKLYNSLFQHQKDALKFSKKMSNQFYLADDMGMGKTLTTIAIAASLKSTWPVLVVCPASLQYQWAESFRDWLPFWFSDSENRTYPGDKKPTMKETQISSENSPEMSLSLISMPPGSPLGSPLGGLPRPVPGSVPGSPQSPQVLKPLLTHNNYDHQSINNKSAIILQNSLVHANSDPLPKTNPPSPIEQLLKSPCFSQPPLRRRKSLLSLDSQKTLSKKKIKTTNHFHSFSKKTQKMFNEWNKSQYGSQTVVFENPFIKVFTKAIEETITLSKYKIFITSYSRLDKIWPILQLKECVFGLIILDEAHLLKNSSTLRFKTVKNVVHSQKTPPGVICLSGTPMISRPLELFAQLSLIRPNWFPKSQFQYRYCCKITKESITQGKAFLGPNNLDPIPEWILQWNAPDPTTIRYQSPPTALSGSKFDPEKIMMDGVHMRELGLLFSSLSLMRQKGNLIQVKKIRHINKIHLPSSVQAELVSKQSGFTSESFSQYHYLTGQAKIDSICSAILSLAFDHNQKKIVVFVYHVSVLKSVVTNLNQRGCVTISFSGADTSSVRHSQVALFSSDPSVQCLVLTLGSAATGISLTVSNCLFFGELTHSPGIMLQAEDRIHRVGQNKDCHIHYHIAQETADIVLWNMIHKKLSVTSTLLEVEDGVVEYETDSTKWPLKSCFGNGKYSHFVSQKYFQ